MTRDTPASGTRPAGITDEKAASRYVREMFTGIAGRYDLLNHLLSFQMDRYWRRVLAQQMRERLRQPGARALDLCCGTADQALALAKQAVAPVFCSDFSHTMLTQAQKKLAERSCKPLLCEADALQLPFADDSFDVLVCSFGFRNLANYRAGLREIRRVLRPGGEAGILEFSEPQGLLRPFYSFYFHHILPRVGAWVSGAHDPYTYLPGSVDRFPSPAALQDWLRETPFRNVEARKLTGGVAMIYRGTK